MAHFCKLGKGNIVERVEVVSNDVATTEQDGIDFLNNLYKTPYDVWKQTSYNTRGGEHISGGTPFRKNFAGTNWYYDSTRDAFIPPKPFQSWILNETTCLWESPVTRPELTEEEVIDGKMYKWNESNQSWDLLE